MGEVIDLAKARPGPVWTGLIELSPNPVGGIDATVVGFSGSDGREPVVRLTDWAHALERLALELRATAGVIGET
jgi:hypothetical protein